MALLEAIVGSVIGGFFDASSAKAVNQANARAADVAREDAVRSRELGLNALTGSTPTATTTRDETGGFDVDFTPGSAAETLDFGDRTIRAPATNRASANFGFTLPTLESAKGVIAERDALGQSTVDKGLSDVASLQSRKFGGLNNSGEAGNTVDALARFASENRKNSPIDAINLFQGAGTNDLNNLLLQLQANQSTAPILTGPGGAASAIPASIPMPGASVNLSSAILPATGSNAVSQILQELSRQDDRTQMDKLIDAILSSRGVGNEGSFGLGTPTRTI